MSATAYRFTKADESAIRARLVETVALWSQSTPTRKAPSDSVSREALIRVGAHAIGCGMADLRDVELDWIVERVDEVLAP